MQPKTKQAEIEKAHVKSLALIAATFVIANIVVIFGLSGVANAQTIAAANPAFDLAKMLAAPEITTSFELGSMQLKAGAVMIGGLAVMAAASISFIGHFAKSFSQNTHSAK